MISKALELNSDSVILDLEDSISINEKSTARDIVLKHICEFKKINKEVIVRINDIKTADGVLDLEAIVKEKPDAIIVPKADEKSVNIAEVLLDATEMRNGIYDHKIKIIPLLETSYSIVKAFEILSVSKRITAVQFGAEDLTSEMSITRTNRGNEVIYARSCIAYAGNALKIDILDTPYTHIGDIRGLEDDSKYAKSIGFNGKTCIHPEQIETINKVFSPDEEDVEKARSLIEAYDIALSQGKGAIMYEGKMIDIPIAERARRLVEKAYQVDQFKSKG